MHKLLIPGKPQPKQRARVTKSGHAYTPQATRDYEATVASIAEMSISEPLTGPILLVVRVAYEIPKSWSTAKKYEHESAYHIQPPDLDNVIKSIKDGLSGIAYHDDKQVAVIEASKFWTPGPSFVSVIIESVGKP